MENEYSRWWVVVDCENDIGDYFRHLSYIGMNKTVMMNKPMWGYHITVVRNEVPHAAYQSYWGVTGGTTVEFEYQAKICNNGLHFWLPVYSSYLLDLRENLGLPRLPEYDLHLTVGNLKNLAFWGRNGID